MWLTILKPGANWVCAAAYSFFVFLYFLTQFEKKVAFEHLARLISVLL